MKADQTRREYPLLILLGAVLAATLLPFVLFSTYSIYARAKEVFAQEQRRLSDQALSLSNAIDRELQNLIAFTETVATSPALRSGDLVTFWHTARDVANMVGGHFVLTDGSLNQLVATRLPPGSTLPTVRNWKPVQEVLETGTPHVSDLFIGSITHEPLFTIRVPVKIAEKPRFVLSHVPRVGFIHEVVKNTALPEGWFVAVLDRDSAIVSRSHRHEDFYGKPASPHFVDRLTSNAGLLKSVDLEKQANIHSL